jgi:hypothetical protein
MCIKGWVYIHMMLLIQYPKNCVFPPVLYTQVGHSRCRVDNNRTERILYKIRTWEMKKNSLEIIARILGGWRLKLLFMGLRVQETTTRGVVY